jgi:hypothetical protein
MILLLSTVGIFTCYLFLFFGGGGGGGWRRRGIEDSLVSVEEKGFCLPESIE